MELSNGQLWFFVALAGIIIWMRMRKKQAPAITRGKVISVKGDRLQSWLCLTTPLECLLDHNKVFGPDFQEKQSPELPHGPDCKCKLQADYRRADEVFTMKEGKLPGIDSDLGDLNHMEHRYYHYSLIANHRSASEALQQEYNTLALGVDIPEAFKQRVQTHLQVE